MQIIVLHKGFYFLGKVKELHCFLAELNQKYKTAHEVIENNLQ